MSEFYIVNECDRPYKRHVAQKISENEARYLHDDLKDFGKLTVDDFSTNLKEFGFKITEKDGVVKFFLSKKSTAKYRDGKPRKWQGEAIFKLKMIKEIKDYETNSK